MSTAAEPAIQPTTPPATPPAEVVTTPPPAPAEAPKTSFMEKFIAKTTGNTPPAKKPDEAKPVVPEAKVETPTDKKETPETPPAEPKPVKRPRGNKTLKTPEEIGAAAGTAAAKAILRETRTEQPPKVEAKEQPPELPEEFKKEADVYRALKEINPEKYGKIEHQLAGYKTSFESYKKQWQKDNPGQKFDVSKPEHDDWYDENAPAIAPEDMQAARVAVQTSKAVAPLQEKLTKLEEDQARQDFDRQVQPEIARASADLMTSALTAVDPTLKITALDEAALKKIEEADPVLSAAVESAVTEWMPVQQAAIRLFSPGGNRHFDAKNPAHIKVATVVSSMESEMAGMPADETQDDQGRPFATAKQMNEMEPAERANYWTFDRGHVQRVIKNITTERVKTLHGQETKRLEVFANRLGYKKTPPNPAPSDKVETPPKPKPAIDSPTVTTGASVTTGSNANPPPVVKGMASFMKNVFGR